MFFAQQTKRCNAGLVSLSFTSVRRRCTYAQRILSNANGTVTDWRSLLAELDLRTSPKKCDLEHLPSSPAIYAPQTSKTKANQRGSKVTLHVWSGQTTSPETFLKTKAANIPANAKLAHIYVTSRRTAAHPPPCQRDHRAPREKIRRACSKRQK